MQMEERVRRGIEMRFEFDENEDHLVYSQIQIETI